MLAPGYEEPRRGLERCPPAVHEHAPGLDTVLNLRALPDGLDLVAAGGSIDRLLQGARQVKRHRVPEHSDVDVVRRAPRLGASVREPGGGVDEQRRQEELQGECQKLSTVQRVPGHGAIGSLILTAGHDLDVRHPDTWRCGWLDVVW